MEQQRGDRKMQVLFILSVFANLGGHRKCWIINRFNNTPHSNHSYLRSSNLVNCTTDDISGDTMLMVLATSPLC